MDTLLDNRLLNHEINEIHGWISRINKASRGINKTGSKFLKNRTILNHGCWCKNANDEENLLKHEALVWIGDLIKNKRLIKSCRTL